MSPERAGLGPVRRFNEIDSTNRYLADEARRGAAHGLVAVAGYQTAGRGRLGRTWEAPPGANLLASVLLYPKDEPNGQSTGRPNGGIAASHACTIAVALAAADSCRELAGVDPGLKWPNDLVVDDLKLAGVLAEAVTGTPNGMAVVVGLGLNVGWPEKDSGSPSPSPGGPAEPPAEPPEPPAEPPAEPLAATSLVRLSDAKVDPDVLLERILEHLDSRLIDLLDPVSRTLRPQSRRAQTDEHRKRCVTLGRRVRVEEASGSSSGVDSFTGRAVELTDEGHLIVDEGTARRVVMAGDVVHLRHQEGPCA